MLSDRFARASTSMLFKLALLFFVTSLASGQLGPCIASQCPTGYTCTNSFCYATVTTTASSCSDIATNCATLSYLCSNTLYYSLMTTQCGRTCGRCTTSSSTCVDLTKSNGVSDCPNLAYLCNNSLYYTLMTQQCPKTCGRCSSG
uniref:ShKT domain-containing protein n=1 Tax=Panagrellus redivivus TaxID=6233 RepID=A0A7E4VTR6_PANRE